MKPRTFIGKWIAEWIAAHQHELITDQSVGQFERELKAVLKELLVAAHADSVPLEVKCEHTPGSRTVHIKYGPTLQAWLAHFENTLH